MNQDGTYLAVWTLLVQGENEDEDGDSQGGSGESQVIVALESQSGATQYALSGGVSEGQSQDGNSQGDGQGVSHVAGHSVVALVAGDTLVLRNRSGETITLTTVGGDFKYSASFTIVKIG